MLAATILSFAISADTETVIIHDDFEQWEWRPIDFNQRKDGRQRLKEGRELPFDYRGPLMRVGKGFTLPSGRMIESPEAYKGRSALIIDTQVGLHGRYSSKIRPNTTYRYRVALKGTGTFHFRAWAGAKSLTTGEFKWLGFPNLIQVKVTDEWKVYEGRFKLPPLEVGEFKLPGRVSAAIVIDRNDRIFVDEFQVWDLTNDN